MFIVIVLSFDCSHGPKTLPLRTKTFEPSMSATSAKLKAGTVYAKDKLH